MWLYRSVAESEAALLFLVDIFEELLNKELPEKLREQLLIILFKYIDKLVEEDDYPDAAVRKCLALIINGMADNETIYLRNSGYLKMYFKKAASIPEYSKSICDFTRKVLLKSCTYWEKTANAEAWFTSKAALFQPVYAEKIKLIGRFLPNYLPDQTLKTGRKLSRIFFLMISPIISAISAKNSICILKKFTMFSFCCTSRGWCS